MVPGTAWILISEASSTYQLHHIVLNITNKLNETYSPYHSLNTVSCNDIKYYQQR